MSLKVLVTGGAGFIGSHVADALVERGDEVLAIDDLSTGRRENLAGAIDRGARLEVADITDGAALTKAAEGFEPQSIIHLAAQMDVRRSVADPAFDARINVIGLVNVLELAALASVPVVFSSTGGGIYGEGEGRDLPFTESDDVRPEAPYGVSKLAGEAYMSYYGSFRGVPAASLRLGNVYGPRQDPHGEAGVVAIFCGLLLAGEPPTVFGDGRQTRDYVYVGDVVEAILAALEKVRGGGGGVFNIGTGLETTVLELASSLYAMGGRTDLEPQLRPARPGEVQRSCLSTAIAAERLGWQARTELGDGLARTLEWARQTASGLG